MPRLVIISERTRYHFQKPLEYFGNLEIIHLYKYHYPDMNPHKFKNLIRYQNIFDLYKKLKQLKPNLIQGLEPYYGYSRWKIPLKVLPIIFTTYFYCRIYKIPYFFHILENILPEQKYGLWPGWVMKNLARIYAQAAKFIFYLNQGAKKNLLHLGISEDKIFYGLWGIWGVNLNKFKVQSSKFKVKEILFVGRLIEQKGLLELVKAYKKIVRDYHKTKLIVVGNGPLFEKLKAKSYQLKANIDFVGQVTNDQVYKYYQSAYMTVSPTRSLKYSAEQIGVTNLESMACGVPVISTFSGSIPEYVIDGKTGLLVPENDCRSLEMAIKKLLNDEKLRDQLSQNCLVYTRKNLNAQKNIEQLEKIVLNKI